MPADLATRGLNRLVGSGTRISRIRSTSSSEAGRWPSVSFSLSQQKRLAGGPHLRGKNNSQHSHAFQSWVPHISWFSKCGTRPEATDSDPVRLNPEPFKPANPSSRPGPTSRKRREKWGTPLGVMDSERLDGRRCGPPVQPLEPATRGVPIRIGLRTGGLVGSANKEQAI
jgi:hypothetical protein